MTTVLLAVGDASGDPTAADFVSALRKRRPDTRFLGMGGSAMARVGVELVVHQRELAVGGIVEVLPSLRRIARAWQRLSAALREARPDLVVLVDSSGFNLPFAGRARRAGVPVLYYVAPQVWAWRRGRVSKLARRVDRLAVILPFEAACYRGSGIRAEFVGHPLVDRFPAVADPEARAGARARVGLPAHGTVVALLPGSRRNELRHCLPVFAAAARAIHTLHPGCHFVLPLAPAGDRAAVAAAFAEGASPGMERLTILDGNSRDALAASDVVLCKPGTATLEAALLDRPCVVAGRIHPLSAALARRLVKLEHWALPNLIAGERIVPEFLQERAEPEAIARAVSVLLCEPARARQRAALAAVRAALGAGGAAERAAAMAEEMLGALVGP